MARAVWFDQAEKWVPFSLDEFEELIFHEIDGWNPETFWCRDEQKLEQLFNWDVSANFVLTVWDETAQK